jgi:hypothetical protein
MKMARCDDRDFYDVSDAQTSLTRRSSPTSTKTIRIRVLLTTRTAQSIHLIKIACRHING